MADQRLFESDEHYKSRAKKEALEESSGLSQRIFESDEDYEKRALEAALEKASGVSQGLFESDEAYQKRAKKIALEKASDCSQGLFESDEAFEDRALREATERTSGTHRRIFESERSYQDRAMRALADDPRGRRGYVYLLQERKHTEDAEEPLDSGPKYAPYEGRNTSSFSDSKISYILKGIGAGLLVDIGLFVITLGGHLFEWLFGIRNYGFLFDLPPVIGGIIGALYASKN